MICPECKFEYVEGIINCPDCGVQLVDEISDKSTAYSNSKEEKSYVFVYNPINSQELSLIKMIMEREQIPFLIKNEPLSHAVLFSIQGPGAMQLYVAEEFAEEATKILKEELGHE
jgi:hypothetical protein